jgi:hypothetical protein
MGQAQPVFPSLFSFTFLSFSPSLLSAQHSLSLFFFFLSFSLLSPLCHWRMHKTHLPLFLHVSRNPQPFHFLFFSSGHTQLPSLLLFFFLSSFSRTHKPARHFPFHIFSPSHTPIPWVWPWGVIFGVGCRWVGANDAGEARSGDFQWFSWVWIAGREIRNW